MQKNNYKKNFINLLVVVLTYVYECHLTGIPKDIADICKYLLENWDLIRPGIFFIAPYVRGFITGVTKVYMNMAAEFGKWMNCTRTKLRDRAICTGNRLKQTFVRAAKKMKKELIKITALLLLTGSIYIAKNKMKGSGICPAAATPSLCTCLPGLPDLQLPRCIGKPISR